MPKRIFSTVTLWSLIGLTLYFFGSTGAIVLMTLAALAAQLELSQMFTKMGRPPLTILSLILGLAILLSPLCPNPFVTPANLLAASAILLCIAILFKKDPLARFDTLASSLLTLILIPYLMQFITQILIIKTPHIHTGIALLLWLVAVTKLCDTGALLTGLAIGKHKMAPNISPKKSWEGVFGGLLTAAGVSALIVHFFPQYFPSGFTPLIAALAALPIATLAIISDLIESLIKRRADTKDSGNLIPGIGGIFDLIDSFLLSAPPAYLLFTLLQ